LGQGFFLNFFYIKKNLPNFFPHKKKSKNLTLSQGKKPEKKKKHLFKILPIFFPEI